MVLMAPSMSASLQPNCRRFPVPRGSECALRGHPEPTDAPVQRAVIFSRVSAPTGSAGIGSRLLRLFSDSLGYFHGPVSVSRGLVVGSVLSTLKEIQHARLLSWWRKLVALRKAQMLPLAC